MSVTCTMSVVEAGTLAAMLPILDCVSALRQRLLNAEAQAEAQGANAFSLPLSPLEQGFLLAALAATTCHFSGDLRARIQALSVNKMQSIGLTATTLQPTSVGV